MQRARRIIPSRLCPCSWCIARGAEPEKFDAELVDSAGVGDYGSWEAVPESVLQEVAFRTPGLSGWQQQRGWTHCGDAAQFIGLAGADDVARNGQTTLEHLRADLEWDAGEQFDSYVRSLDAEGQPTQYLLKCPRCREVGGYSDFT